MPNRALRPRSRFQVQRHSVSEFVKEPSRAKEVALHPRSAKQGHIPWPWLSAGAQDRFAWSETEHKPRRGESHG